MARTRLPGLTALYIRYSTRLPLPAAVSEAALPEAVQRAADSEPSVGFNVGPAAVRKRVRLQVGPPERLGDWLRIPLTWSAHPGAPLFPVLDGYLQLEPLTPRESRLSIKATYQPPLGRLGQAIDGAALHTVARATVRDFVDGVRSRVLEATAGTGSREA